MAYEILPTTSKHDLEHLRSQVVQYDGVLPVLIHPFFTAYNTKNPALQLPFEVFKGALVSSLFDSSYFRALLQFLKNYNGPLLVGEEYYRHTYTMNFLEYLNPTTTIISYKTEDANPHPEYVSPSLISQTIELLMTKRLEIGGQLLVLGSTRSYFDEPTYVVEGRAYTRYGLGGCVGVFLSERVISNLSKTISLQISSLCTIRHHESEHYRERTHDM